MSDTSSPPSIKWHRLLGTLLEEVLIPVGISVTTEFPIMSDPPIADILLLRKNSDKWTIAQRARLPDGIRDSHARHILLEFKYSESVNERAILQALGYDSLYKRKQRLTTKDVQTFLLSSKTTNKQLLAEFGYQLTEKKGVYVSNNRVLRHLPIVLLNELEDVPHNTFVKCFASRPQEKHAALETFQQEMASSFTQSVYWLIVGLQQIFIPNKGDSIMTTTDYTAEQLIEVGKSWYASMLKSLPPEERFVGLTLEERLAGLDPEERLAGLDPEERLAGLDPEERLAGLDPEEMAQLVKAVESYLQVQRKKGND